MRGSKRLRGSGRGVLGVESYKTNDHVRVCLNDVIPCYAVIIENYWDDILVRGKVRAICRWGDCKRSIILFVHFMVFKREK